MLKKRSFFERLTGGIRLDDEVDNEVQQRPTLEKISSSLPQKSVTITPKSTENTIPEIKEEVETEGELTVDVYQTPTEVIVQTMVAGVRPEDVQITITRDMITIRGRREENKTIQKDQYVLKELYWGTFSRTVSLPHEVEPDMAEAIEKHGLLIVKIPKIDRAKQSSIKVKSI